MSNQPIQKQTPPTTVPPVLQDELKLRQDEIKQKNILKTKEAEKSELPKTEVPKTKETKKPIESEQKPTQTSVPTSPNVKTPLPNQSEIKTPEKNLPANENPTQVLPIIKRPIPTVKTQNFAPLQSTIKQPIKQQITIPYQQNKNIIKILLQKAREHIQKRRQKRLNKILIALKEKNKLSNKEIRKIVRVSEATITRYMDILEKQNKIKQVGKEGRGVYYELK